MQCVLIPNARADNAYNFKLSDRCTQSSLNWIIDKGIDSYKITGKGYGETQLINALMECVVQI